MGDSGKFVSVIQVGMDDDCDDVVKGVNENDSDHDQLYNQETSPAASSSQENEASPRNPNIDSRSELVSCGTTASVHNIDTHKVLEDEDDDLGGGVVNKAFVDDVEVVPVVVEKKKRHRRTASCTVDLNQLSFVHPDNVNIDSSNFTVTPDPSSKQGYTEYFMPVLGNRDKIRCHQEEQSEEQREKKSSHQCCRLCCWLIFFSALLAGVAIAVLIGVGVIYIQPFKAAVESRNTISDYTNDTRCTDIISASLRIDNIEWKSDYLNKESQDFLNFTQTFEDNLQNLFLTNDSSCDVSVKVINLSPGSVVVSFKIVHREDEQKVEDIENIILNDISESNGLLFNIYAVPISSIVLKTESMVVGLNSSSGKSQTDNELYSKSASDSSEPESEVVDPKLDEPEPIFANNSETKHDEKSEVAQEDDSYAEPEPEVLAPEQERDLKLEIGAEPKLQTEQVSFGQETTTDLSEQVKVSTTSYYPGDEPNSDSLSMSQKNSGTEEDLQPIKEAISR